MLRVSVVIPNWNGEQVIGDCLDSLLNQTLKANIIVVENGSIDGSIQLVKTKYPEVKLVINKSNLGFAGGVNSGIKEAMDYGSDFIALFNNDAVADKNWLSELIKVIEKEDKYGIVTSKILDNSGSQIDSTGDFYTVWGLPFPRGRGEKDTDKFDKDTEIFAASGGASLYRASMLQEIGLFDEDFFAYYEDVDLSFRAQLAGWKVAFVPKAIAYHQIGVTSSKIKGFTTYQTMKNLPWLFWKNVPLRYLFRVGWRFRLVYISFFVSALRRGQGWPAFKGSAISLALAPKKLKQRFEIQKTRRVAPEYIWGIITHDLPPNATKLRSLRSKWRGLKR